MTMEYVIKIAKQVYGAHTEWNEAQTQRLKEIEALIRQDEREACAKLCEAEVFRETQNPDKAEVGGIRLGARLCAGYIRARGNK